MKFLLPWVEGESSGVMKDILKDLNIQKVVKKPFLKVIWEEVGETSVHLKVPNWAKIVFTTLPELLTPTGNHYLWSPCRQHLYEALVGDPRSFSLSRISRLFISQKNKAVFSSPLLPCSLLLILHIKMVK